MAGTQSSGLSISAIIDSNASDATKWIADIKEHVPTWGSVSTWQSWKTDNVVVSNYSEAVGLLKRKFQQQCNLYLPQNLYADLERPLNVKLFNGSALDDIHQPDQLIAMHLTGMSSDIVLLLNFDLAEYTITDKYQNHLRKKYLSQVLIAINAYPLVQWVCVDHTKKLHNSFKDLPNLTIDSVKNVKAFLI